MVHELVHCEMWKEADALDAKWLELKQCPFAKLMQCPHCQKKIDFGFTFCTWCMRTLGAYAHSGKVGGDSSLDQGVTYIRFETRNKSVDGESQQKFDEFFAKQVRQRSKWGQQGQGTQK